MEKTGSGLIKFRTPNSKQKEGELPRPWKPDSGLECFVIFSIFKLNNELSLNKQVSLQIYVVVSCLDTLSWPVAASAKSSIRMLHSAIDPWTM